MAGQPSCQVCGKSLGTGEAECPTCLLNLALETSSGGDDGSVDSLPATARLGEGDIVGPYRIVRELGEGGMGVVYLAAQSEPIKRQVALKVIKRGMDTEQVVRRFEAERQALAMMDHVAIARVHEAGETAAGRPYFSMEYIDGEPISTFCERNGLGIVDRLELFCRVCEGVQHAHRRGIIHRDIKPSNILVTETDGVAQPKIIDFGVAKATEQSLTEHSALTAMGVLLGTPEYMSPEQADLSPFDVDTRTDVYSLGVVLYELLAGKLPFDSRLLKDTTFDDIRRQIREVRPARPGTHRRLAADLDLIAMKALEKDRDRRYGSPAELADDIRRHLSNEPVLARPTSTLYQLRKLAARNPLATGLLVIVVVLAIVGTVVNVNQTRKTRAERDRATREAETARSVSSFLEELFSVADPRVARGVDVSARDVLDQGAKRIESDLAGQPEVQTRLLVLLGGIYHSLGVHDEALDLLNRSAELGREVLRAKPRLDVERLRTLAWIHRDSGRLGEALEVGLEGHERAKELEEDDPLVANTLMLMGVLLRDTNEMDRAREFLDRALAVSRKHHGEESVSAGWTLYHLGWLELRLGREEEASRFYESACTMLESVLKPNDPGIAGCLNDHVTVLQTLGRFDEAGEKQRRVIEMLERVLPPGHPQLATAISTLATQFYYMEDYDAAESHYLRALAIREETLGADHPDYGAALCSLGFLYGAMGREEEAEDHYLRCIGIIEAARGPDAAAVVNHRFGLARLYERQGRFEEVLTLSERAIESRIRTHGADHRWTAGALRSAAMARVRLGRFEEAIPELERAVEIAAASYPQENTGRRRMEMDLAFAYEGAGRTDRAREVVRDILETTEETGTPDEATASAYYALARLARVEGNAGEADALLQQAIDVRREIQAEDDPTFLYVRSIALAYGGEREGALEMLQQSLEQGFPVYHLDFEVDLAPLKDDRDLEALLDAWLPSRRNR